MLKPSDITTQALKAWVPTYLALMLHGSTIETGMVFYEYFVIYPLLCGAGLAAYTFYRNFEEDGLLESIGMPPSKWLIFGVSFYVLLPVAFVLSAMLHAQLADSYERAGWVAIVFGGVTINEAAIKIKEILKRNSR